MVHDERGRILQLLEWIRLETTPRMPSGPYETVAYGLTVAALAEYVKLGSDPVHPLIRQVRAHVALHLGQPMCIAELAAFAGLSRHHFSRRYHELAGITPMADVQRLRLEAARHLVMTTDLPLKDIAQRVGFSDASHLANLFRKRYVVGTRSIRN
jgi:transcriptional regulator GlxA family with amidase domain